MGFKLKADRNFIYIYAMHVYDLIFYSRLIDDFGINSDDFAFQLIVADYLLEIDHARDFIEKKFGNFLIAPLSTKEKLNIFAKYKHVKRLKKWYSENVDARKLIVLTDKSSVYSRFFLRKAKNAILVQQIENIDTNYKFDLVASTTDFIRAKLLGAYCAKHYVNKSSGGIVRAVKLNVDNPNFAKVFYSLSIDGPAYFRFPLLKIERRRKVIIFGSRFFSWPYFQGVDYNKRLNRLRNIYYNISENLVGYDFVYIPHPLEFGKEFEFVQAAFSGKLTLAKGYFSAEHYLYENRDVAFTFSIGSTSSFSAFNMGFSAKVFYKMLDFPEGVSATYDDIFAELPTGFFATTSTECLTPETYQGSNFKEFTFGRFLHSKL